MVEGSETPGGEQGFGGEGRPRRGEGDLLSERRARRAAESGEVALTRRAEAAEATVQTLERHVASLQQRLREVEQERLRAEELLEVERAAALEREHELRRVKQREYAEQQLRIEAEDRLAELDRQSHEQIGRLDARLEASERGARELEGRLERLQHQLAEAGAHAEGAGASTPGTGRLAAEAQQGLLARLGELERRVLEVEQGLAGERAARERAEQELEAMRIGSRRMELLIAEVKGIVARASAALGARAAGAAGASAERGPAQPPGSPRADAAPMLGIVPSPAPTAQPYAARAPLARAPLPHERPSRPPAAERGAEMARALAEAVERLRARAEAAAESAPESQPAVEPGTPVREPNAAQAEATGPEPESARPEPAGAAPEPRAAEAEPEAAPPEPQPVVPAPAPSSLPAHKHSMSLLGRLKMWRKQRRAR